MPQQGDAMKKIVVLLFKALGRIKGSWHLFYFLLKLMPENRRLPFWNALRKYGVVARMPDKGFWIISTFVYSGEKYALPGDGGGINSVIRWQQMYWDSPLKVKCSDKLAVREFVREKIGGEYLIPMLPDEGVFWTDPNEIDFDALPERFVLKCNNGSGMNIVVTDKSKLDIPAAKEKMRGWIKSDFASHWREWHYREIPNRIYCEKFIDSPHPSTCQNYESTSEYCQTPPDYKFMCSDGKVLFAWVDTDRFTEHKRNFFDLEFNQIKEAEGVFPRSHAMFAKPSSWEKMEEIAEVLSQGIPLVRVDLYNVEGKIFFGEMTFTPSAGWETIRPLSLSKEMAAKVDLKPFLRSRITNSYGQTARSSSHE